MRNARPSQCVKIWHGIYCVTSGAVSFLAETVEQEVDLSEVLLDFDLMEDLLELFGVLVEASLLLDI